MLRAIALKILEWLEESLDPEAKARADALRAKVADQELERAKLMEQIRVGERELMRLSQTLTDNRAKEVELNEAIRRSKEAAEAKKAELDALPARDRVRLDV